MKPIRIVHCCAVLLFLSGSFSGCAHKTVPLAEDNKGVSTAVQNAAAAPEEGTAYYPAPSPNDAAFAEAVPPPSANGKDAFSAKKENGDDEQVFLDTALELTETAQEYWEDGDVDHAIEALDQAYALILRVSGNNTKFSQQKEDLRIVISKRIIEVSASRKTTVKGTSSEIPMTMNDYVQREIQSFQTLERDFFIESYKRSGKYRNEMVKALKEAGMPEDLSWLPLIESGFKVRALSRSRALGLWQFIPSTGYKYGLKRNTWIDERLDPPKATAAAIAYFKDLHEMFGDWATVLAAYNCGEGNVARVISGQKINYLDNFWDLYERLPRETARYYPRFLAVLAIVKEPTRYGFTLEELDKPLSFETISWEKPVQLKTIADSTGIDEELLSSLNPELRHGATPNVSYALRVPPGTGEKVLACSEKLATWAPPKVEYVMHRVRRGETLTLIALRYRTTTQRIIEANHLRRGKTLRVGQKLKIPTRNTT
jgi:membrane-bound lytic murein transglycosylase D